jgi:uncharacterized membrane protein
MQAQEDAVDVPLLLALWFHTVALVIAWGYYGILGRIVIPALGRSLDGATQARTLAAVERQALPIVLAAVVLFTVTGTYLLVDNPRYEGLGTFFDSTWSTLMLVKHALVVGFVVLAIAMDRSIRRAAADENGDGRALYLRRARLLAEGATGLGALIVLLTAAAQVAD